MPVQIPGQAIQGNQGKRCDNKDGDDFTQMDFNDGCIIWHWVTTPEFHGWDLYNEFVKITSRAQSPSLVQIPQLHKCAGKIAEMLGRGFVSTNLKIRKPALCLVIKTFSSREGLQLYMD
jgi:hypothetical protein